MEIETAITLIERMVYRPGWRFVPIDHTKRVEGCILLEIHYGEVNTDRDKAKAGFPEYLDNVIATEPILVGECETDQQLYFLVLMQCIEIEIHEARELLRMSDTHHAPFHPHKPGAMRRFREHGQWYEAAGLRELERDIKFGRA